MNKEKFEEDILDVLKKYGYKIEGIQILSLRFRVSESPEVEINYLAI